jgi:hypothetical protein
MIFIAGVSPKIKVLDQNPRRCPVCGLHQAYNKRMDHYLSLFFIPILRVKNRVKRPRPAGIVAKMSVTISNFVRIAENAYDLVNWLTC